MKSSRGQEKARVVSFNSNFPDSIANALRCEKEQNLSTAATVTWVLTAPFLLAHEHTVQNELHPA